MYLQKNRHCGNERKCEPLGCSNMKMWPRATRIQQRMMDLQQVNQGIIYGIYFFLWGPATKSNHCIPKGYTPLALIVPSNSRGVAWIPWKAKVPASKQITVRYGHFGNVSQGHHAATLGHWGSKKAHRAAHRRQDPKWAWLQLQDGKHRQPQSADYYPQMKFLTRMLNIKKIKSYSCDWNQFVFSHPNQESPFQVLWACPLPSPHTLSQGWPHSRMPICIPGLHGLLLQNIPQIAIPWSRSPQGGDQYNILLNI